MSPFVAFRGWLNDSFTVESSSLIGEYNMSVCLQAGRRARSVMLGYSEKSREATWR